YTVRPVDIGELARLDVLHRAGEIAELLDRELEGRRGGGTAGEREGMLARPERARAHRQPGELPGTEPQSGVAFRRDRQRPAASPFLPETDHPVGRAQERHWPDDTHI